MVSEIVHQESRLLFKHSEKNGTKYYTQILVFCLSSESLKSRFFIFCDHRGEIYKAKEKNDVSLNHLCNIIPFTSLIEFIFALL